MDRDCTNGNDNAYFRYRKLAATHNERLNSREGAAELLGYSASTIAGYELGVTKTVPPEAVVLMADLYNAPELKAHYCAKDCPIGRGTPIATETRGIESVAIRVIRALAAEDADEAKRKLLDIAQDGEITRNDNPSLAWLLEYLEVLSMALGELRLTCHKHLAEGCRDD